MNRFKSQLLKAFLNHKFKQYGKMTTLQIDTEAKAISINANLLGESALIEANVRYARCSSFSRPPLVRLMASNCAGRLALK